MRRLQLMILFCLHCVLLLPSAYSLKPPGYVEQPKTIEANPPKYAYNYAVANEVAKEYQGHEEKRDGINTSGSFYVDSPGARSGVNYFVDDWGFHAVNRHSIQGPHSRASGHFALGYEAVKALHGDGQPMSADPQQQSIAFPANQVKQDYYQPAPQAQALSQEQVLTQQYIYPVQNVPLENTVPQYQPSYAYQPLPTTLLAPISNAIGNAENIPYVEQQGYDPSGQSVQLENLNGNQYAIVQPQQQQYQIQQEQPPQYQQYQQIQQPEQQQPQLLEQQQYNPSQEQTDQQGISQLVSSTQKFVSGQDLVNINGAAQEYQQTNRNQNKKLFEKNQGDASAVASEGQNTNSKIQEENDNNNAEPTEQQFNSNGHFAEPIIVEEIYDNKLINGDNTEIKIIPSREYNAGRALEYPDRQINVQIIKNSQNQGQFLKQTTVSATTEVSYHQQQPTANTPSLKILVQVTTPLPETVESTQRPSTKFLAPINAGLRLSNAGKAFQDCLDLVQHHGPLSQVLLPKPLEKQHLHEKTTVEVQKSVNVKNIFIQENAPIYQTRYFLKQPKNIQIAPQQNFVQHFEHVPKQNFVQHHEEVQDQNLVQHFEQVQNQNFIQNLEQVQNQNFVQHIEQGPTQNFVEHHEQVQKIEIEPQPHHAEKLVQVQQIQPNVLETPVVEQKVFEYPAVEKNPVRPVQLVKVLQYQLPVQAPVIAIPHQNLNVHNTLHEQHSHQQASNQALVQNSLFNGHLAATHEQVYYKPLQPVQYHIENSQFDGNARHQEFGLDNGYLPPFAEFTQYEVKQPKTVYGQPPVMSHFHGHPHNSYASDKYNHKQNNLKQDHARNLFKDEYIGPVPLMNRNFWPQKSSLKLKRTSDHGRSLNIEYGFKPPMVPSIEIDELGEPIKKTSS